MSTLFVIDHVSHHDPFQYVCELSECTDFFIILSRRLTRKKATKMTRTCETELDYSSDTHTLVAVAPAQNTMNECSDVMSFHLISQNTHTENSKQQQQQRPL